MATARIANAKAVGGVASFAEVASVVTSHAGDVDVVAEAIDALSIIALRCTEVRNTSVGKLAIGPIIDALRGHRTPTLLLLPVELCLQSQRMQPTNRFFMKLGQVLY